MTSSENLAVLRTEGLSTGYGRVPVVHDLNLNVLSGELVALLGANGAGKTTTLLTLSGDLPKLGGVIEFKGLAKNESLCRRSRRGLGFVTEERSVFMSLSVMDNLLLGRGDLDRAFNLFPELVPLKKRTAGLLSGGEQQMLTLARALSRDVSLLLVDELSLGLAPLATERLFKALRSAVDDLGLAALVVEQQVNRILEYADRAYVLQRGRIVMEGEASSIRGRLSELEDVYLSDSARAERSVMRNTT